MAWKNTAVVDICWGLHGNLEVFQKRRDAVTNLLAHAISEQTHPPSGGEVRLLLPTLFNIHNTIQQWKTWTKLPGIKEGPPNTAWIGLQNVGAHPLRDQGAPAACPAPWLWSCTLVSESFSDIGTCLVSRSGTLFPHDKKKNTTLTSGAAGICCRVSMLRAAAERPGPSRAKANALLSPIFFEEAGDPECS